MVSSTREIEHIAGNLVPSFADFCSVHLLCGRRISCAAYAHATPDGERLMREYTIPAGDPHSAVAHVIRTGSPLLRRIIQFHSRPGDASGNGRLVAELHRQLAPRSALVVPIACDEDFRGALSLCYSLSCRSYAGRDVAGATQVAARIARVLVETPSPHGTRGLRPPARHARQGAAVRRRVAARD